MSSDDVSIAHNSTPPTRPGLEDLADLGGNKAGGLESLACVPCRSRKLKCDRTAPACTRCRRLKTECAYPESRRKPTLKRRNVKELEERLAQVEVLLKDAAGRSVDPDKVQDGGVLTDSSRAPDSNVDSAPVPDPDSQDTSNASASGVPEDAFRWIFGTRVPSPGTNGTCPGGDKPPPPVSPSPFSLPDVRHRPRRGEAGATRNELLGLGLFEALPPTEMIEELHQVYFTRQHPLVPIIHPARYMKAFFSAPHLRPPMSLAYAIWTMAANGHEKYSSYHDAFHRRARHYLEEDELRGEGEHFLTIAHAQAWALISTDEARSMWFTRAAMSASRCIKLLHMMGLHRLDDPNAAVEMAPTIAPPRDWAELEERRRVFWGAFCIDSHASISTGWPCLIDVSEVTTHLPSSEEAFNQGMEEKTSRLEEVFTGSSYSSFAGAAVICHIFNQILKHVHRSRPGDAPEDLAYGPYWNRHRALDNLLSSAFMFLPERFRLPNNMGDPVAVHTNLNLHASVICLHNSAYEMANQHNLPEHIRQMSKTRLLAASQEVVNIVKITSHLNIGYRSPLVALALYVASSVYISLAQDDGLQPDNTANLEFLLTAMEAIGRRHAITKSFLRQAIIDLRRGGLLGLVHVPHVDEMPASESAPTSCGNNIPLFARSRVSRHMDILPPLPGRLPLNSPIGSRYPERQSKEVKTIGCAASGNDDEPANPNKRKRVNLSPDPTSLRQGNDSSMWPAEEVLSSDTTRGSSISSSSGGNTAQGQSSNGPVDCAIAQPSSSHNMATISQFRLPHRGGSSAGSAPSAGGNSNSAPNLTSQPDITRMNLGRSTGEAPAGTRVSNEGGIMQDQMANTDLFGTMNPGATAADLNMFRGLDPWDVAGMVPVQDLSLFSQLTGAMQDGGAASLDDDSWMLLSGVGDNSWVPGGGQEGGAG